MSGEKTTNELIRVALPARLVTVRRFLEALDADTLDPEAMVTVQTRGGQALIVSEPVHDDAHAPADVVGRIATIDAIRTRRPPRC